MSIARFAPVLCATIAAMAAEPSTRFRFADGRIDVMSGEQTVAASPAEGLWSIACGWRDGWPTDWVHASPATIETAGEWTIAKARVEACGGTWALQDSYRLRGGVVEGRRRFQWLGGTTAKNITLSVRFIAQAARAAALLPGNVYYGNPSGAKSGRVPVWTGRPGEEAQFEEHRYPMPFAFLELEDGARRAGFAIHTLPSPVPYANLRDQWWSLGVAGLDGAEEVRLLSGPCAVNGKRGTIKSYQRTFSPYDDAYLNIPPGETIEKTFYLEAFPVAREGTGFRRPVRTSLELFQPFDTAGLPAIPETVRAKYRYAQSRWREQDGAAGFRKYDNRNVFVMGWTGEADALGYALPVLEPLLNDPRAREQAQKSLDFLSTAPFNETGFRTWYDYTTHAWSNQELLNQGQAMQSFARAIRSGRARRMRTEKWEAFLRYAADVHSRRILDRAWHPLSTHEATYIAPLIGAFELFGVEGYKQAALKAARHYAERHLTMREPYWGGTSDASCEDKEGAAAAFAGFLALYEHTRDPEHLEWARHACDVILTYVVDWDIDLPPGRMRDAAFKTRGWTAVSVQNQHLDVWGAILAPDIYRLGQIDQREDLRRLAMVVYRTCGQLIDPYGGQGEQMEHTNYVQRKRAFDLNDFRGGYNDQWTVFWITAHFLTGAARFVELGVPIGE